MNLTFNLTALLIVLQLLDVASTAYALKKGIAAEGNPIVKKFIEELGVVLGLVVMKAAIMTPIIYIGYTQNHIYAIGIINIIYITIVINNVMRIKKITRES